LAWLINKIVTKERAGEQIFWIVGWQKKNVYFFGKGYFEKCKRKEQQRKRRARRVKCKIKMPITCVKGSCFETPLYVLVLGNKRDGDKDRL
jgi:hypothetical protein